MTIKQKALLALSSLSIFAPNTPTITTTTPNIHRVFTNPVFTQKIIQFATICVKQAVDYSHVNQTFAEGALYAQNHWKQNWCELSKKLDVI